MANNTVHMRTSPRFKRMIEEIKSEEMKRGKLLSDRRITDAIVNVPNLKEVVITKGVKDDRKKKLNI